MPPETEVATSAETGPTIEPRGADVSGAAGHAPARLVLVGVRGFGQVHAGRIAGLVERGVAELVAAVDPAVAREASQIYGADLYAELSDALDAVGPVDVVVIAAPLGEHARLAEIALRSEPTSCWKSPRSRRSPTSTGCWPRKQRDRGCGPGGLPEPRLLSASPLREPMAWASVRCRRECRGHLDATAALLEPVVVGR